MGQTTKLIAGCKRQAMWKHKDFPLPVGRSPIVSLLERIFWIIGSYPGLKSSYPITFSKKNFNAKLLSSLTVYLIGEAVIIRK